MPEIDFALVTISFSFCTEVSLSNFLSIFLDSSIILLVSLSSKSLKVLTPFVSIDSNAFTPSDLSFVFPVIILPATSSLVFCAVFVTGFCSFSPNFCNPFPPPIKAKSVAPPNTPPIPACNAVSPSDLFSLNADPAPYVAPIFDPGPVKALLNKLLPAVAPTFAVPPAPNATVSIALPATSFAVFGASTSP